MAEENFVTKRGILYNPTDFNNILRYLLSLEVSESKTMFERTEAEDRQTDGTFAVQE